MKNRPFKRILSLALSVMIALGVFVPGTEIIASATIVDSGTCGENLTWTLDDEGLLTISGEGEMEDYSATGSPWYSKRSYVKSVNIDDGVTSIGSYAFYFCTAFTSLCISNSVNNISKYAFSNCYGLTNIIIPNSVISIGEYAFEDCLHLTDISIPNSVTSIGGYAISGCYNLTNVIIPNSITRINDGTFEYCKSLTNIIIPDSVTSIGNYAFEYCESLTSIIISDSVKYIGDYVFSSCAVLSNITIPDSVISIGYGAFKSCKELTDINISASVSRIGNSICEDCTNLASITVDPKNQHYSSDSNGVLFDKNKVKLIQYPAGNTRTEFVIPNSVTNINSYAFKNCSNLTSLNISEGVIDIGTGAFYGCTGLVSISIPSSVTSIGRNAFWECTSLTSITVDLGNQYYSSDEDGVLFNKTKTVLIKYPAKSTFTSYTIPDSVISIEDDTFRNCRNLTSVTIGNSVTSIGVRAFYGTGITSIIVPDNVSEINYMAFSKCANLKIVDLGDNVTKIGTCLFEGCTSLESVIIPEHLTSIGFRMFYDCTSLTSVTVFGEVTSIEDYAFYNCVNLTSITISDGVTGIGNFAFFGCSGLTNVTIPNGITSIGDHAFHHCISLISINNLSDITSIGECAFNNCTNLTGVNALNGIRSIGTDAFLNCIGLTSITIPESVTSIGDGAFQRCTGLTSVTVPDSVTSIGRNLFCGCTGLTSVIVPNSIISIGTAAFKDCTGLTSIAIPDSVISIGGIAFQGVLNICYDTEKMKATGSPWGAKYVNKYYENNILYENSEKEVIIKCSKNAEGEIIIPNTVTEIKASAFADCLNLTNVIIPNSVQKIGKDAFKNVMNITYDPEKMTAEGAPWGAKSTTAYTEGDFVYYDSSKQMLIGCISEDKKVTVPDCVEAVDGYAFAMCDNLESVTFTSSSIEFDPETLAGNSSIKTISSANTENDITFTKKTGLNAEANESPLVTSGNLKMSYLNGYLLKDNGNVELAEKTGILFCNRSRTEDYAVPEKVSFICENAFANCNITVSMPYDSITSIGPNAFLGTKNYQEWDKESDFVIGNYLIQTLSSKDIYTVPANIVCIADEAFRNLENLARFTFSGSKLRSIGKRCFSGCIKLRMIEFPSSVTRIGADAFEQTAYTKSEDEQAIVSGTCLISVPRTASGEYVIPDNITCIAEGAFNGCERITSVKIPDGVTNIGPETFSGCCALETIEIPDTVTSIGKYAFRNCTNLTNVNIPESVNEIGEYAFYGCLGLTGFEVEDGNTVYMDEEGVLFTKDGKTLIQYPVAKTEPDGKYVVGSNVTVISGLAFRCSKNIDTVYIPQSTKFGYKNPFEMCKSLYGRYEDSYDEDEKDYTLYQDKTLVSVSTKFTEKYPDGVYEVEGFVNTIGANAFSGNTALKGILLPDGLKTIEEEAFKGCTGLTEVDIPVTVTEIKDSAFEDCTNLGTVNIGLNGNGENESLISIGAKAFSNCNIGKEEQDRIKDCLVNEKLVIAEDAFHIHNYGEWKTVLEPTCEEPGKRERECTCGHNEEEVIKAKGHTEDKPVNENVVKRTCTKDGKHDEVVYCTECKKELSRNTVTDKAQGHIKGTPVRENETASSCSEAGTYDEVVYCSECGSELSRELKTKAMNEHIPGTAVIENEKCPTCTEKGSYEEVVYCTSCHKELSREPKESAALDHEFGEYKYNNDATTEKDGTETAKCIRCDETDTRAKAGTKKAKTTAAILNASAYNGKETDYRTTITFHAEIRNKTDAEIKWYNNGKEIGKGESVTITEAKENINIYFVTKDADGNEVKSETETVKVKTGFFQKLIAFFKGLFGLLPVIDQK